MNTLTKRLLSILIVGWMLIVIIGPLSNPIASQSLSAPAARVVAPIHRAMFLGHGYRFFGPDPGPSHIVAYKISSIDGNIIEGRFPDRDQHWPRQLYHRWFMLSETVYQEYASLYGVSFDEIEAEFKTAIQVMHDARRPTYAREMKRRLDQVTRQHNDSVKRFRHLLESIAGYLKQQHGGEDVELFLIERAIAPPLDVVTGIKLEDPRYLTEPFRIWPLPPLPAAVEDPPASPDDSIQDPPPRLYPVQPSSGGRP